MDCKRCGAPLNQGAVLCPECGARQRRHAGAVHCARCYKTVPLGLTVCPHCGRDVRPAGPRWEWWGVGLIALVLVSLWGLGKLPIEQAAQELQTGPRARVRFGAGAGACQCAFGGAFSGPGLSNGNPGSGASAGPCHCNPGGRHAVAFVHPAFAGGARRDDGSGGAGYAIACRADAAVTATATPEPTAAPTGTPTATPMPSPTATLRPPTATPTAARSTASGTTTYRVQSGDTLSSIATRFGITWEALAAANGLTSRSTLRVGQELTVPLPGAAVPPAATPAPRHGNPRAAQSHASTAVGHADAVGSCRSKQRQPAHGIDMAAGDWHGA